jgi:exonuclease III
MIRDMSFRVVSWNVRFARPASKAWEYLLELEPDIALLQEVIGMPDDVTARYDAVTRLTSGPSGEQNKYSSVVLAGHGACESEPLRSATEWVDAELALYGGNLISTRVRLRDVELHVISVHSPYFRLDPTRLAGKDTAAVKLTQNADIYLADVLLAALPRNTADPWIVGGDFNLSETFDHGPGGPRGNREYLDRMTSSGYTECLRSMTGGLTPTFRNRVGGAVLHQIDHIFVSDRMAENLEKCEVGSAERVFGDDNLSDHLPIIAEFAS